MFVSISNLDHRCPFALTFSLCFPSRLSRRYTYVQTCATERKYHCQLFRDYLRKHHESPHLLSMIRLFSSMLCAKHCSLNHRKSEHTGFNMQMINIVYVDSEKRVFVFHSSLLFISSSWINFRQTISMMFVQSCASSSCLHRFQSILPCTINQVHVGHIKPHSWMVVWYVDQTKNGS